MKHTLLALGTCLALACSAPAAYTVYDWCPPGGTIEFYWTINGAPVPPPIIVTTPGWHSFSNPPPGANDWHQTVTTANGITTVFAGQFNHNGSAWEYAPELVEIPAPGPPIIIPDPIPIIPIGGGNELFTAVNLEMYFTNNPDPGIGIGDTVAINNGEITGLVGIVFSTTEPVFDPNSTIGWGNITPFTGDANVASVHMIPEPAALALLALGGLGVLRRRR